MTDKRQEKLSVSATHDDWGVRDQGSLVLEEVGPDRSVFRFNSERHGDTLTFATGDLLLFMRVAVDILARVGRGEEL